MPKNSFKSKALDKDMFKTADKTPSASRGYNYVDKDLKIIQTKCAQTQADGDWKSIWMPYF